MLPYSGCRMEWSGMSNVVVVGILMKGLPEEKKALFTRPECEKDMHELFHRQNDEEISHTLY